MSELEQILLILISFSVVIIIIAGIIPYLWKKWFDSKTWMYHEYDPENHDKEKPLVFSHNGAEYKVYTKSSSLKNPVLGRSEGCQTIIYIDDNPVISITSVSNTFTKRVINTNIKYKSTEAFRILRWARKAFNKKIYDAIKETSNQEKLIKEPVVRRY